MQWSKKSAYAVGAVFSVLIACTGEVHDHDQLREDVLYCEEAVSALSECCPGFKERNTIVCNYAYDYIPGSCGSSSTSSSTAPDLSVSESRCILGATCDSLQAHGICDSFLGAKTAKTVAVTCR
ncbi:MAG: hypothetical protein ABIP39_04015 [Polyangiaceae bacterium]